MEKIMEMWYELSGRNDTFQEAANEAIAILNEIINSLDRKTLKKKKYEINNCKLAIDEAVYTIKELIRDYKTTKDETLLDEIRESMNVLLEEIGRAEELYNWYLEEYSGYSYGIEEENEDDDIYYSEEDEDLEDYE